MKFKAIIFPLAIGALAFVGACSSDNVDTPTEEPGAVEQIPSETTDPYGNGPEGTVESPGMVSPDTTAPDSSSMESPVPAEEVPPAS
jgi:hypothetical protein